MAVFQRTGIWYLDYYYQGKRIRESVGTSKREAEQALAVRKAEIIQGRYHFQNDKLSPQFSVFAVEYLDYQQTQNRSWKRVQTSLNRLMPYFGDKHLAEITPKDIELYKQKQLLQPKQTPYIKHRILVKPATINHDLAYLKNLFTIAIKYCKSSDTSWTGR